MNERVILGDRYKDRVSGWEGVAVATHSYVWGCRRVTIAGVGSDGKPDEYTFDEPQLAPSKAGPPIAHPSEQSKETGGPRGTTRGQP